MLLCFPLTIVFNLMENSVSKSKGLPPIFAPTIVAIGLWLVIASAYCLSMVGGY